MPMEPSRPSVIESLDHGEFSLVYQPIVDLESWTTVGLEVLVRWHHPVDGELSPGGFIKEFERNGAIADLGTWVTRRAMDEALEWQREAVARGREFYLSVNVSGYELQQPDYSASLVAMCDEAEYLCKFLRVEVLESEFDLGGEAVRKNLATLRQKHIMVMIDDFGTGASTVDRLIEIDADAIKLDASVIADIDTNPARPQAISAVTSAAELAGLEVIAEGIERDSQVALLAAVGCRYGQGYLFSAPVAADAVPDILEV